MSYSKWSKTLVPLKTDSAILRIYLMNFIYFIHVRCWNIFAIYVTSFIHVIHVIQWKFFMS